MPRNSSVQTNVEHKFGKEKFTYDVNGCVALVRLGEPREQPDHLPRGRRPWLMTKKTALKR